ncbi:MAG: GtrA family protein [Sulfurimonas sp.]|jgi:putative flippase GtrA
MYRIFKFLYTGGFSTLVHYASMFGLVYLSVSPIVSTFIGAILGAIVNYILQYYITFNSKKSHFITGIKYIFVVLLGVGSNTIIFALFYEKIGFTILVAQVATTTIVTVQNFLFYKFLVFKERDSR